MLAHPVGGPDDEPGVGSDGGLRRSEYRRGRRVGPVMTRPTMFLLDEGQAGADGLENTLRRRYSEEYEVVRATTASAAVERLSRLRTAGQPVAIVFTWAATADGVGFLADVRRLHPTAKRVLVVAR